VQEPEYCLLNCLVVELPGGSGRPREQCSRLAVVEGPEIIAVGALIDPKKVAHDSTAQTTAARESDH
jgi:hypothetical protein